MEKTPVSTETLMDLAQRQVALRDELLRRHSDLVREVSEADVHVRRRAASVSRLVAAALLVVLPSGAVVANTPVPDGRDMSVHADRAMVLNEANQIIASL